MSIRLDIPELERLAKAATPGPWESIKEEDDGGDGTLAIIEPIGFVIFDSDWAEQDEWATRIANCDYIAAANPHAVLALIERVCELEAQTQWARAGQAADQERAERLANENGTLKERVRELDADLAQNNFALVNSEAHVSKIQAERKGTAQLPLENLLTIKRVFKDWNNKTGVVNAPPPDWLAAAIKEAQGE